MFFYKEKFEYKCTVRHVDAQKKFLAKIKTDSFSKSTSANALFCILLKRLVTSIKTHDRNGHTTFNCVLKKSFYLAISCREFFLIYSCYNFIMDIFVRLMELHFNNNVFNLFSAPSAFDPITFNLHESFT